MKITCQACQAKYTIADEKVVGKIVKIRCKKCGASIVVNGNEPSAGSSQPPPAGAAFDYAAQGASGAGWTVNVADGDQRTMTDAEIIAAYRSGVVKDDTFCWKEGMTDWLPIQEIPALLAACNPDGASASPSATRQSKPPARGDNGSPASVAQAARRAGRAAAADLFSGAAQAGGEDEVMTSAPAGVPQAHADGPKPAPRKENNTLFGMGPDKAPAAAPPSMTATTEASGLIDIRQLGAQIHPKTEEKKASRVDDIMNLGGGGGFSPSLAAPVLSAPSLEHYSKPPPGMPESVAPGAPKNKAMTFLALGAGTFFLVAAVGIAVVLIRGNGQSIGEDRERTSASASAAAASASPGASGAAASTASASPEQAAAAPSAAASGEAPGSSSSSASATKEAAPKEAKQAVAPGPAKESAPPATTPPPSSAEFNLGEARARLAAVAGGVQTCKRGDTTGSGKVEIVFGPSGAVQSATLMGGSPFDGTPTGKCVEARFRQARVPAFGGGPVPVTKSFSIN